MRGLIATVGGALCLCLFAAPAQAFPRAQIIDGPPAQSTDTTAAFAFVATGTTMFARFMCRIDGGRWTTCGSPARYERVAVGAHSFEVRLLGLTADHRPDVRHWTVLPPPAPPPPSPTPVGAPSVLPPTVSRPPPPPASGGCANAGASPSEVSAGRLADSLRCLLAAERRTRRLPVLRANAKLARAANDHAVDMLEHRFFGHRSTAGDSIGERVRRVGYLRGARRWEVSEALHWGEGARSSPAKAMDELLSSPRHRQILLSRRLRDVGVAAVTYTRAGSGKLAATYVVDMGRRW